MADKNIRYRCYQGILVPDANDLIAYIDSGSTGGVTKDYVDTQDQAVLKTANDKISELAETTVEEITKLDNSVVHTMEVPTSTTLTDEQKGKITSGIYMNGTFLGLDYPVFYPATNDSANRLYGLVIGKTGDTTMFCEYTISTANVIGINTISGNTKRYWMSVNNNRDVDITSVKTPTQNSDAANKVYVDTSLTTAKSYTDTKITEVKSTIPTKTSQLTNDSGFLTSHQSLDACEKIANKVSTIAASDTTYPTCNAVINYIASLNGDNDTF